MKIHDLTNEIQTISGGNTLVSHDRNGCMTKVPQPNSLNSAYTLVYDAWNRLISVSDGDTLVVTYVYDARNHRIKKTVGTVVTLSYFNQNWQEIESVAAGVTKTNVYGLRYIDDVVCRVKNTEVLYALQDTNWNVVALVTPSGVVAERITYDSFGKPSFRNANFTAKTASSYGWSKTFTSQVYDSETGLMLYRNRYYHTGLGRFITRDPIGYRGEDFNLYRYVFNWPVRYTDYIGLWGADVHHDMTLLWINNLEVFPSEMSEQIVYEDEATDGWFWGNGPWPGWGDQGMHFNRNPEDRPDSRIEGAIDRLEEASNNFCKGDLDEAIVNIGQGLHALQDFYAHGDYGRQDLTGYIWRPHNTGGPAISGLNVEDWEYPDLCEYDAQGSEDGRPAGPAIHTKMVEGPSIPNYSPALYGYQVGPAHSTAHKVEYAVYVPGHKRITATEMITKKYVMTFIDRIKKQCREKAEKLLDKIGSIRPTGPVR